MNGIVERVFAEPSIPPVIAITEVGQLKSATKLDCGMAIDGASNRPILKIFNHNGGTVEEEDRSRRDFSKKYLVLKNKKTNKITIYKTKVMYLKKPNYLKLKTYEDQSLTDKNVEFNMVFGTKKAARLSKSKTNDEVNISSDVLNNISASSDLLQNSAALNEFSVYLPVGCNRFSTKIENVYPVSTLLFENEIDLMTDFAKEIITMMPLEDNNEYLSTFFITNFKKLTHKTIQNICLLAFADGLVELLKTKPGELNEKIDNIYPYSQVIQNKLVDNFLEYKFTGREISSRMKDKAVCHIIIAMVLINMNVIDLGAISPFLPTSSQKRFIILLRVVGLTRLKEDKTKYSLKIPLASLPPAQKLPKRRLN